MSKILRRGSSVDSARGRPALLRVAISARDAASHLLVMMDDDVQIMTGPQVADLLQVPPRTLEEWRQAHTGPPWQRVEGATTGLGESIPRI